MPAPVPLAALNAVPAAVPAIIVVADVDVGDDDRVATVRFSVRSHPRLDAVLSAAGARRSGSRRWTISARRDEAALAAADTVLTCNGTGRKRRSELVPSGGSRTVTLTARARLRWPLDGDGTDLDASVTMDFAAAVEFVDRARAAGWIVATASPGHWAAASTAAAVECRARPVPGAPSWCTLHEPGRSAVAVKVFDAAVLLDRAERAGHAIRVAGPVDDAIGVALAPPSVPIDGLWPHQRAFAARYRATGRGVINAAAAGTGKTRATASALATVTRPGRRSVVVAPPGTLDAWRSEIVAAIADAEVTVATDTGTLSAWTERRAGAHLIVVTTPDVVRAHFTDGGAAVPVDDLVVDEASWLGNPRSKRSQALHAWRQQAGRCALLTATPGPQLPALATFALGEPVNSDVAADAGIGELSAAELLGPYLWSSGWGGPGPQLRPVEWVVDTRPTTPELAERIARHAGAVRQALNSWGAARGRHATFAARSELVRAWAGARDALWSPGAGARDAHAAALATACAGPVCVFATGDELAAAIVARLDSAGRRVARLDGRTSARRRTELCASFEGGDIDVLVTGNAGGQGLNLGAAARVVHADLPDGTGSLYQRAARATRADSVGQLEQVVCAWEHTFEASLAEAASEGAARFVTDPQLAVSCEDGSDWWSLVAAALDANGS